MQNLNRKQVLKNSLIQFLETTKTDENVYSIQTDINKGYWIHKGILFDNNIFNLSSAKKVKANSLDKNTVYYISTINENQIVLFNVK
jgi:hypothetical protein